MIKLLFIPLTLLIVISFNSHANKLGYFNKIDSNNDQVLDKTEFALHMNKYFAKNAITDKAIQQKKIKAGFKRKDTNKDGKLTFEEFSGEK